MNRSDKILRTLVAALRHRPELLNLSPDKRGYCTLASVKKGLRERGISLTDEELKAIAGSNERLGFDKTGSMVRADYGSSLGFLLADQHEQADPPAILYHGTSANAIGSIKAEGILRPKLGDKNPRDHVFLTDSTAVGLKKGARHGSAAVLVIRAEEMAAAGYLFYHAKNDIWLTDHVPPRFIDFAATIFNE